MNDFWDLMMITVLGIIWVESVCLWVFNFVENTFGIIKSMCRLTSTFLFVYINQREKSFSINYHIVLES